MQTLYPGSGLRTAPKLPKIRKMTMASQFPNMTSTWDFFDVVLFLLSSLVTGPIFMPISLDNFLLSGIDQKSDNRKYPRLSFSQYLGTSSLDVDVVLFLMSSLVAGTSVMSILSLVLKLWQFPFIRDWPEIRKSEIPPSEFWPISRE